MGSSDDIKNAFKKVTADWTRQKKAEEREPQMRAYRGYRLAREGRNIFIKEAAAEVMEAAYMAASTNDTLPATARQVMYAARRKIQAMTGRNLDDAYFTQTLLPDYIAKHGLDWNVVYDERGHLDEPHTNLRIGLGTLSVDRYIDNIAEPELIATHLAPPRVETRGPNGRYGAILFIEKEGFLPLLEQALIAERFDLAIMSTKGMSVTAARRWIDEVCGDRERLVPVFVLHDFDPYGFTIHGTLTGDTRRYDFENKILVHDIGLRLTDIRQLNLPFETQHVRADRDSMADTARQYGATEDEIATMFNGPRGTVQRVELNALSSDQLLNLIETRLHNHDICKVIPDTETIEDAYRLFVRHQTISEIVDREIKRLPDEEIKVPRDLRFEVFHRLQSFPPTSWDGIVQEICQERIQEQAAGNEGLT
jgi:hypothetical protein